MEIQSTKKKYFFSAFPHRKSVTSRCNEKKCTVRTASERPNFAPLPPADSKTKGLDGAASLARRKLERSNASFVVPIG